MELREITTFLQVAKLQSFSRAAESLGYSQAAVTIQIKHLEQELGMEVVCFARREELSDQEDFYRELRGSESALLFGSSFEQDGADELEIPLIRMDYPVFDEVCLTPRPHLGGQGTLHLLEDIFRGIMNGRTLKGALYQ